MAELVTLTIVANEPQAEMVCGLLRADGIQCMHRITNLGFGSGGELPSSGGGAREVLVHDHSLEAARALLAAVPGEPSDS